MSIRNIGGFISAGASDGIRTPPTTLEYLVVAGGGGTGGGDGGAEREPEREHCDERHHAHFPHRSNQSFVSSKSRMSAPRRRIHAS